MAIHFSGIFRRLFQPSTLRGIVSGLALFGVTVPEPIIQAVSVAGGGVVVLYEVVRDELRGGA